MSDRMKALYGGAVPLSALPSGQRWGVISVGNQEIGKRFSEPIIMVPGNAKARRRWRRRNIPNTQRTAAIGRERAVIAAFFREDG